MNCACRIWCCKAPLRRASDKRLTVFSPLAEARFPYFPTTPRRVKMSLTSRLTLLSAVMRRESCPRAGHEQLADHPVRLYVGVEFYGSWSRYARLSSDLYMELLPSLGVSRRDGYDIECFITRHAEGEEAGDRRYRVRYFIPVTLSAAGLRSDSGSGSGPVPGRS